MGFAAGEHALVASFDPRAPGQAALLCVRAVILAAVALATRKHVAGAQVVLLTAALFAGSLVVPGGILALIAVGVVVLARLPAVRMDLPAAIRSRAPHALGLFVAIGIVIGALRYRHPGAASLPASAAEPRASALAWLEAGNRYRARAAAIAWAKQEGNDPGEGYFFLARMDHELGYESKSRKALEKIRSRSSSEVSRQRAADLLGGEH